MIDLQAVQSPTTRGRGIGRYARSLAIALETHEPGVVGAYLLNPRLPPPGDLGALVESGKLAYAGRHDTIPAGARLFHAMSPLDTAIRVPEVWPAEATSWPLLRSATIYDFIPALDPGRELADAGERRRYRLALEALRGVDGVQTLSGTVTALVTSMLGAEVSTRAVGAAPDAAFARPESTTAARALVLTALRGEGLVGPYVLCPSGSHPRKNNELLIQAFAAMRPELRAGRQLVITGALDGPTMHHYAVLASTLGAEGAVVTPGYVPDVLLAALHGGADLVCYPTLAEGSTLPIAEAFACGAAVIASDRAPLDELVSPAGRFDPTDARDVSSALERVLGDDALRDRLRQPASPLGDWRGVAQRSAAAFDELLAGAPRPRTRRLRRRRPRIAFVSPLPPAPSGVAGYSYTLLEALARTEKVDLDVYRDGPTAGQAAPAGLMVRNVASLPSIENLLGRYDDVLYALGNSHHHLGALALLRRRPGTVLAHDVRLSNLYRHEAGARGVRPGGLERAVAAMYRGALPAGIGANEEFGAADLERYGLLMAKEVIASSDRFLVSSEVAATLARLDAGLELASRVAVLPFAVGRPSALGAFNEEDRTLPEGIDPRVGRLWASAPEKGGRHSVLAHFGIVDPVKLPEVLLEAFALLRSQRSDVQLVFVGPISDDLARSLSARAVALGIADGVGITGPLHASAYASWFARATLAVQLRASSNGEASAAVGECLSSGVATIVSRVGWTGALPEDAVAKLDAPASPLELSRLFDTLLADASARRALEVGAARYGELHGFERTARALLEILLRPERDRLPIAPSVTT